MQLRTGILVNLPTFSFIDHTYVRSNKFKGNSCILWYNVPVYFIKGACTFGN